MKRFPWLLLTLFLLTGCAAHAPQEASAPTEPDHPPVLLYDANSQLEAITGGALLCYPLYDRPCTAFFSVGDSLYLFYTEEEATTISRLDTETGSLTVSTELPFSLDAGHPSIHPWKKGLSCFDPLSRQTILLDEALEIVRQVDGPQEMMGTPILSENGENLFYCTADAIRSLELQTGISRVLKESCYREQSVSGLILKDQVLLCTYYDGGNSVTLFLDSITGSTLGISDKISRIQSQGGSFYAQVQEGHTASLVFGGENGPAQSLVFPDASVQGHILSGSHAAVTVQSPASGKLRLDHYCLHSGLRTGSITLNSGTLPSRFTAQSNGNVWFLNYDRAYGCDTLYCWIPSRTKVADGQIYTGPYHTQEHPDDQALTQCLQYAQALSTQYGIEILVYQDVNDYEPEGCKLTCEHLAPVLMWELEQLEKNLADYPPGFLQTIAYRFEGLTICILRDISGTDALETTANSGGIVFWNGTQPCIALVTGTDTQRGLYHALCHLIDTIVLNECSAYDTWSGLNPTGFQYDYDYIANRSRNSTAYLLDSSRYFIDMFSMSFPKEDRARIMEYAMTPGNKALFQTDAMQKKLHTLCTGIREAFRLEDCTDAFLWEQYLHTPLAPEA